MSEALTEREWVRFDQFSANPCLDEIARGAARFREQPCDTVVAIGGGTALDLAKLIAAIGPTDQDVRATVTGQEPLEGSGAVPVIAVPTTAGTGSEATQFAVAYVDGRKYSVSHPSLLPREVVLDPDLLETLPRAVRAASGLDALCQAIESMWSVRSTAASRAGGLSAMRLAWKWLVPFVEQPSADARAAMCCAAHLAGRAIQISRTTAAHALSYPLTSEYDVPHGFAVALFLPPLLRWNAATGASSCVDPRGARHVRTALDAICREAGCPAASDAANAIHDLVARVGGVTRLADVTSVDDDLIEQLVQSVNAERLANNPRRLRHDDLRQLIESVA